MNPAFRSTDETLNETGIRLLKILANLVVDYKDVKVNKGLEKRNVDKVSQENSTAI